MFEGPIALLGVCCCPSIFGGAWWELVGWNDLNLKTPPLPSKRTYSVSDCSARLRSWAGLCWGSQGPLAAPTWMITAVNIGADANGQEMNLQKEICLVS